MNNLKWCLIIIAVAIASPALLLAAQASDATNQMEPEIMMLLVFLVLAVVVIAIAIVAYIVSFVKRRVEKRRIKKPQPE